MAWIGGGFVGFDLSFTTTFFPFLIAALALTWIRSLFGASFSLRIDSRESLFAVLATAMCLVCLIAWAASGLLVDLPMEVRLFNLVVPLGLFLIHLAIWTTPLRDSTRRRLIQVLLAVAVLNAFVSFLMFVTVNVLRWIPTEIFFLNPRYPVILFSLAGRAWVRTPGIFESGGSNGSFLLLTFTLLLSFVLFSPQPPKRSWLWWLAIAAHTCLIVATLTRRSILGMLVAGSVIAIWSALLRRRVFPLAALFTSMLLFGTISIAVAPELVTSASLLARAEHWQNVVNGLFGNQPGRFLIGFGILQPSLPFLPGGQFEILDNALLELLMYGGVCLVAAVVAFYLLQLRTNVALSRTLSPELQWLARANVVLIGSLSVVALFVPFVFSVQESIPCLLALNVSTKFLLSTSATDPSPTS